MSEFSDAKVKRCPICGKPFATCEGMECHCMEEQEELEKENAIHLENVPRLRDGSERGLRIRGRKTVGNP